MESNQQNTNNQATPGQNKTQLTGPDYPSWRLFSTTNTFILTPSTIHSVQKSLIIDKKNLKIKESSIVVRDDAEWAIEVQGLLGIMNILGIEHLMVVVGKEEVCKLPHKLQPKFNAPSVIFELQEVELIPFVTQNSPQLEFQLKQIRDGIKKFLECGFYLSYRLDLTSNAQRREKLLQGPDLTKIHPFESIDYRYMWNFNLYKQLRTQHVPIHWMIPLIQGYVGHAKQGEIEQVLIARRRWLMGGTRYNARGIDELGNVANCVETEQIVMRNVPKDTHDRIYTYSFTQIRGSIPFFWQQESGKIEIHRSLDSSVDAFTKHCETLMEDYEGQNILIVNLLNKSIKDEELLTQGLVKLREGTSEYFQNQNKKVDYEYFDFHQNCRKGTGILDTFIQDILMIQYLRDMGVFCEKYSVYKHNGQFVRESRRIYSRQTGVVRTNCLDCLDRTNVFQSKVSLKVFEELLKQQFTSDKQLSILMTNIWALCGDFISKIYAGTHSVLTQVTLKGKENIYDKIDHGVTSVRRFIKQNLSDDFKQECILVMQGQHELCNSIPTNFVESVVIREIDQFSENQKIIIHITTLNCGAKTPESHKELIPIFQPRIEGVTPDIMVIGLQEIVKLNSFSIFQGKNRTKMNEWEQYLRLAIEEITKDHTKDPDERFVWVIAKAMVGCFIGLFVKQKLLSRIKDLKTTKIKTGLGGSAGNKGAVIVRFNLDDTSIMLMNCHLMSGKNKGSKRTDELNFIFDNAFKGDNKNRKYCIENHQMVFIFGDLNYRINLPNDAVRTASYNQEYAKLKDYDELLVAFKQFENSKELQYQFYRDFAEGDINFQPTYKYDRKSQRYDSSKKNRTPSWCDRILWKKNPKVTQQILGCIQNITFSDHRPVFSQFEIYVSKIVSALTNKMEEKFFENMRFQSLYVYGAKSRFQSTTSSQRGSLMDVQVSPRESSFNGNNLKGQTPGEEEKKQLDQLDEQLNRFSQNSEHRYSENPLVPLIEEADEEEVETSDFTMTVLAHGESTSLTAVGKSHNHNNHQEIQQNQENNAQNESSPSQEESDMIFDESSQRAKDNQKQ